MNQNKYILDIEKLNEYKHNYLKQVFNFPDYYGNTLDSFYDCITDINNLNIEFINIEKTNSFSKKIIDIINNLK